MKINVPVSRVKHTEKGFTFDKSSLVTGLLALGEKNSELGLEFQALLLASSKFIQNKMDSSDSIFVPFLGSKE